MTGDSLDKLPVAGVLDEIVAASRTGAVVVTAPPGSGKTTLVPGAVLDDLPAEKHVVLIQPRRLAARAVARRIAHLRGSAFGDEVGYQVRFDKKCNSNTRLLVVTTGILLRRLFGGVVLGGGGGLVVGEFHERTIGMELVLGVCMRVSGKARPGLGG